MANEANSNQSGEPASAPPQGDNATAGAEVLALAPELGPNGESPGAPPAGSDAPSVDSNLILDTFFGGGEAEPNPAPSQAQGSNGAGGQEQGPLAPPAPAPAANGGEGSPQPGPSPTQQPPAEQGGAGAVPQTPSQGPGPSGEQPPAPQDGLSVEDRLRLASANALADQNRQLLERLRALESGQQPPPQGQGQQPQPAQPGSQQEPPVNLVVPNDLFQALNSDDPQQAHQALTVMVNAVAINAVQAAVKQVQPMIDARLQEVLQGIESSKQVGQMEEKYFERFPSHSNELYKTLIQQVVDEKYKLFPNAPWDDLMIDSVGSTVNARLAALGINVQEAAGQGQGQPQPNGGQQPAPRPQPAPMLDASTRGGNGAGVPHDAGDFIRSTFG